MIKIPKTENLYNNKNTFVSPIFTFSLAGNIIVYSPIQGTNMEKYFNHIIYKGKILTSLSNSFYMDRAFSIIPRKKYGFNPSEMDIKVIIPAATQ